MSDDSASPADLVGTILAGRYRIVQRLGEGAMGAVYLGEHIKMGRRDAIKVLRESLATDREATLRFLRGARTVSSIRHPNVCTIYDFSDTADGLQFLAMEFVAGETLKDLLDRERRLPVERAVAIAIQVAEALDAAHDVGVVHRDLKPGNIMLVRGRDGRDVVKVVDFDIAKGPDAAGEEVTRMGFVVGTPEYMSPEQLMGEALNGRSDVYSLALVLFRMLTGALPFQAETTQDVMIQRLTHAPLRLTEALPDGVFPARLQHAIERALDRRAAARPDATEFSRELAASLVDAGAVAAPAGSGTGAGAAHSRSAAPPAELPATRVSPASPASAAAGVANNARGRRRRNIAIAAAVVVVAVIGASAMLRGGAQPADGGGNAVTPDASPVIPAETAVITPPPAPPASPPAGPQRNRGTTAERDDPAP
ncbi:MAG: serine/threonine-protein kinase, partial [Longimicrobiales bacterium]